jgi:hypothetical protein
MSIWLFWYLDTFQNEKFWNMTYEQSVENSFNDITSKLSP